MTAQYLSVAYPIAETRVALPMDTAMPATCTSGNHLLSFAGRFVIVYTLLLC